eukprot:TRINITY_DN5433_c0_g2_i1.p1 TRINITY_DN5433_c0_g2~~TRINITY_DN5433_c0_g2_i1.p1  ORF type:complete len:128 (-),score=15.18 TRINITY_DN5433_c0_g2_i1:429-812(-)
MCLPVHHCTNLSGGSLNQPSDTLVDLPPLAVPRTCCFDNFQSSRQTEGSRLPLECSQSMQLRPKAGILAGQAQPRGRTRSLQKLAGFTVREAKTRCVLPPFLRCHPFASQSSEAEAKIGTDYLARTW